MAINRNNRLALQEQEPDVLTRYRSPTPQKSFRPMPAPAPAPMAAAPAPVSAPMAAAPVSAPMAAPAPAPVAPSYKYTGESLEDYLAKQRGAFTPRVVRPATYSYGEGGDLSTPEELSTFDPVNATKQYADIRVKAAGLTKDQQDALQKLPYRDATKKLAEAIGYKGPLTQVVGSQSMGANEGGYESFIDTYGVHPDFADVLKNYRFAPAEYGRHPGLQVYDATGKPVSKLRVGDGDSKFDKLMEIALPALLTGGFGAAGAAAMGLSGLAGAAATGAIGSGLNTGIQGGDLEDVLKSALTGGVTGGVTYGIGQGVNAIAPKVNSTVSNFLADIGLPEELAFDLGEYTKPVLRGAATGVLKGDILGGITDSLAGQIVADISPSLKLTPAQGQAVANYLRTGDEAKLAISLGTSLARSAINAANNVSAGGTSKEPFYPADSQTEVPSIDEELGFANYSPYGTTDEIMSIMSPTTPAGTQRVEVTPPQSPIDEELGFANYSPPAPQQVTVAGAKPQPEDELPLEYRYSGETSPIATGGAPQQVTVTGKKPVDEEFDLPPYLYEIPELAPMPIPEVPAPTPPLALPLASAPAPAPKDNSTDIEGLLNMLALGQQQPVPSQVLAQMPGFNVGREMDYSRREQQQPDLAALLAAVGYKG